MDDDYWWCDRVSLARHIAPDDRSNLLGRTDGRVQAGTTIDHVHTASVLAWPVVRTPRLQLGMVIRGGAGRTRSHGAQCHRGAMWSTRAKSI